MIGNNSVPAKRVDERFVIGDGIHIAPIARDRNNSNRISSVDPCYLSLMTEDDVDSPGKRLRFARKNAGFSAAKSFAEKVGVNEVAYRARAMNITARGVVTVEDVRWGLGGCEMLIRWNNVSGSAEWKSGITLSILE